MLVDSRQSGGGRGDNNVDNSGGNGARGDADYQTQQTRDGATGTADRDRRYDGDRKGSRSGSRQRGYDSRGGGVGGGVAASSGDDRRQQTTSQQRGEDRSAASRGERESRGGAESRATGDARDTIGGRPKSTGPRTNNSSAIG